MGLFRIYMKEAHNICTKEAHDIDIKRYIYQKDLRKVSIVGLFRICMKEAHDIDI